jgi:hypothetical protein
MPRKREDMTDEEYQAMLKRLSAMREKSKVVCAAKKAARSPAPAAPAEPAEPAEPAAPEPEPEPDTFNDSQPPEHIDEVPTPMPQPPRQPPRQRKAKPIAITPQPQPRAMDENELDKYFQAKYKWKTAYAAPQPVAAPVREAPPPPMAAAVRNTAQDQIRTRVNDEVMKMAMKSVFPDWN